MRKLLTSIFCLGMLIAFQNGVAALADDSQTAQTDQAAQKAKAEFDGKCAMGVADGHMGEPGDAKYQSTVKGKTYYFCSPEAKSSFMKDADKNASQASLRWANARANKR